MQYVSNDDLLFISKFTGLSLPKTISLVEEDLDLALILEHIAKQDFKRNEILHLSFLTFCKLIVFKYTDTQPTEDKNYIAKTLFEFYPEIRRKIDVKLIKSQDASEKYAQYCLIFCGFFYDNEFLKLLPRNHIRLMENGFHKRDSAHGVAQKIRYWIQILNTIDQHGWLKI